MSSYDERLHRLVQILATHRQRATYGAVGKLLGRHPRSVMRGQTKCQEYSWIVAKNTKMPTGYAEDDIDPSLETNREVIDQAERLAEWLKDRE